MIGLVLWWASRISDQVSLGTLMVFIAYLENEVIKIHDFMGFLILKMRMVLRLASCSLTQISYGIRKRLHQCAI